MRPRGAAAACAAITLAAVFSVQQGEHGPLVVYKLQLPDQRTPAPSAPVVIPSRAVEAPAPAVLGTVVMPAAEPPPPAAAAPGRIVEGVITLQQVSDDILWRRDTAERLPESPFAPRF